ncbi:tRNA (guanine-N(7)-)-methyltransferase non-catalytic subunit trm82 [Coemansia sp. RSA 2049]|nr:tRNA (guanine-N(7)-)-methyltransferase non-catalytic subunit trm82 [Coemansia sp. RSA 2049]
MPYLHVTVLEADSHGGLLALAFGADFHVVDNEFGHSVARVEKADNGAAVKAMAFSRDGGQLAACTNDKGVWVYDTGTWECVRRTTTEKRTNAICFDASGDYLVTGDKFGDSYRISVRGSQGDGGANQSKHELLLGHVSIICDVKFTVETPAEAQQYILTCDRDEKIRVSKYPNAYNIQAFCLGHSEFVTTIATAAFAPGSVVSGSGDGTVRLWSVMDGQLLQTVGLEQYLCGYYADGRAVCGENTHEDRTAAEERYGVLRVRACDKLRAFVAIVERIPAVVVFPFAEGGLGRPQVIDIARAPTDIAVLGDRVVVSLAPALGEDSEGEARVAVVRLDESGGACADDSDCAKAIGRIETRQVAEDTASESIYVWGNKMYLGRPRSGEEEAEEAA